MRGPRVDVDTYGCLLAAAFDGREVHEIMERDDGLVYAGDPRDYFAPYRRWPRAERRALSFVRGRVLDVGCGGGRVSLYLQERGHDVVAIDESRTAVDLARRRGVRCTEVRKLTEVDAALGPFDTVLLLRNNFGLAGRAGRTSALLRRLAAVTSERGRIVTDSVDPARLEDPAFRDYPTPAEQRFRVRWRESATPWFTYLMLEPTAFERLVSESGWSVLSILDYGLPRYGIVLEKVAEHRSAKPS